MALALIIPFHNEDLHLPRLISSLREQSERDIPVVFVDNASTDASAAIVQACEEIRAGKWRLLEEKRIGKFHAMKTAVAFCTEQFGVSHVGLIDADSYFAETEWVRNSVEITDSFGPRLGYCYSPVRYHGFEQLPAFKSAYLVYERITTSLIVNVGWLANGQAFVCSANTLTHYFDNAEITTEFDLRCSLLALSIGQRAVLNPSRIVSSDRRIIVNAKNFAAWCFYEREFYSKKDINAKIKLNLKVADRLDDLQPSMARQLFRRRAFKVACRHLIPFAIFTNESAVFEKIRSFLGIDASGEMRALSRRFRHAPDMLLSNRFETMIQAIENDQASIAIANRIENLMWQEYEQACASTPDLQAV